MGLIYGRNNRTHTLLPSPPQILPPFNNTSSMANTSTMGHGK